MRKFSKGIADWLGIFIIILAVLIFVALGISGFVGTTQSTTCVQLEEDQITPLIQHTQIGSSNLADQFIVESKCVEYVRFVNGGSNYYIKPFGSDEVKETSTGGIIFTFNNPSKYPNGEVKPCIDSNGQDVAYQVSISPSQVKILDPPSACSSTAGSTTSTPVTIPAP